MLTVQRGTMLLTEFDTTTCSTELQMLKALLPFTDLAQQKTLAVFIRIYELMTTISFYQNLKMPCPLIRESHDEKDIINELKKYCPKENLKMFDMISNFNNMEKMYGLFNTDTDKKDEPKKDMSGFLTPSQKEMYESYKKILNI